jgi:hypothetical protein
MKGSKKMAKYKDKDTVSEATEELSESVREANRVIADSVVAAQERNWKFAQSIFEDEVELFKSHAESASAVMEKLVGESEKGPALFQSVAESAVDAQKRNIQFVQSFLENGTEVLRSHVDGTRTLMQTLTEQSHKQREAFGVLVRGTWDAYRGFFPSPLHYYERAMETVESIATQGVDTAQKMVHQGMGTAEKATHHERQTAHTATK